MFATTATLKQSILKFALHPNYKLMKLMSLQATAAGAIYILHNSKLPFLKNESINPSMTYSESFRNKNTNFF